ncbi:hypothetical protein [Streptosporangium carneum]|uniref:Uncharacterized protein n=1 Tax=Streptosporangium carneum TaxID=47481 RepID=A0A9W6I6P2_9ACTN|nr:hypothetical protein [Streptosporangium carneum]GLK13051.1 hypothetical protein GCM10017600_64620 [Streptosporangium carneum]
MREPRWGTPRPAAATVVGLVLVLLLAAVAPSTWSGGWRPAETGASLWVPQSDGTHRSTAPRLLAGVAEHLPTPGQLRSLLVVGVTTATPVLLTAAWLATGPSDVPRGDVQRVVTSRGPPRA